MNEWNKKFSNTKSEFNVLQLVDSFNSRKASSKPLIEWRANLGKLNMKLIFGQKDFIFIFPIL